MGRRLAAWWRWAIRPWRSIGLITALIASFAVPAFMAASSDVFLVSASDSITRQVLDDHPSGLDVTITAEGRISETTVETIDAAMRDELARVGRLAAPARIIGADVELQRPPTDPDAAPESIIGSRARLVARDGALEALEVVDGDRTIDGIWISQRFSERLDLPAGSLVTISAGDPIPVAGVFADLWDGEPDPYWEEVPARFVPRFSAVFGGPLFETIVASERLIVDLDIDGLVRWDSALADRPDTLDDLIDHANETRRIELSYTESPVMAAALAGLTGDGGPVPVLVTDTFDLLVEAERISDELEQPIATAANAGIALGLIVTAAGAAFAVRKWETEIRLLRADGDAAWRFGARALLQFAAPAMVGAVIGVGAAAALRLADDGGRRPALDVIDLGDVVRAVVLGLALACGVTALAASRILGATGRTIGAPRPAWFLPIVGVAVAAWIQVGAADDAAEVDLLVVVFPLVGLVAGVGLGVLLVRWLMRRARHRGGTLPTALFLAWRRITATDASAALLSAALGIALGLIVFSTSLVNALETASDAKSITATGGVSQARLDGRFDADLPARTTPIRVLSTRSTIGDDRLTVLAIDPASFADGVSWHPSFGGSPAELVQALDRPADADVAAVIAGRIGAPAEGGFGTAIVTSYAIVDRVEAVPLTSEVTATLVVSAEQVDLVARNDHEARRPEGFDPAEWADSFESPLARARTVLVSQFDGPDLATYIDDNGLNARELDTLADRREIVGNRSARWTFEYLGLLAAVAGLAAVGTLFFYLSEQRSRRELATVMTERMGLRRRTGAVAAVGEILGLMLVALLAGTAVGLVLAARIFDRFEPEPRLAPDIGLDLSWSLVGSVALVTIALVVAAALTNHWATRRRSYAEVLREA